MSDADIWQTITQRGVLASVHIGRHRFEQTLAHSDLGLSSKTEKETTSLRQYVKPGVKRLLPDRIDKKFRSLEASARRTLTRTADDLGQGFIFVFDTPYGPFIPSANLDEWLEKISEYKAQYMGLKDALIATYPKVKAEVLREYASIAVGSYRRLRLSGAASVAQITEGEFVHRYLAALRKAYPTTAEIEEQTYFDWDLRNIALPDSMQRAIVAESVKTDEDKAKAAQADKVAALVRESTMRDVARFQSTVSRQMYALIVGAAENGLNRLKTTGDKSLSSKTVENLQSLPAQVARLNMMDNAEVAEWALQIGRAATGSAADLEATLSEVRRKARATLQQFETRVRRDEHAAQGGRSVGEVRRVRRVEMAKVIQQRPEERRRVRAA